MEYILESVFEVGFERRGLPEAVAIMQLGNFASCQQQHSTFWSPESGHVRDLKRRRHN